MKSSLIRLLSLAVMLPIALVCATASQVCAAGLAGVHKLSVKTMRAAKAGGYYYICDNGPFTCQEICLAVGGNDVCYTTYGDPTGTYRWEGSDWWTCEWSGNPGDYCDANSPAYCYKDCYSSQCGTLYGTLVPPAVFSCC